MGATTTTSPAEAGTVTYYLDPSARLRWWDHDSGRTGWVISGGSDTMGAEAPELGDAPPDPVDNDPAPEPADTLDAPPEAPETDPAKLQELVDKYRTENQKYKQRFRPYEETFGKLDDQASANVLSFFQHITSGDPQRVKAAAEWMRVNLDSMSPAEAAAVQAVADDASEAAGGDDDFDPYDPAAIRALVTEEAKKLVTEQLTARERAQQDEADTQKIIGEMDAHMAAEGKRLGIPHLDKKDSVEFKTLIVLANDASRQALPWEQRITAAAEALAKRDAANAKAYLQRKSAEAEAPVTPPAGGAPSGSKTPKDLKEASKSGLARLEAMSEGPGSK